MDLIYMTNGKVDIGVLHGYRFDLAFGSDENNFQITVDAGNHVIRERYFIYMESTEYGGIVDQIQVVTDTNEVRYSGRTWHGILDSKILQPDSGRDYLTVSGDANAVLQSLIARMGLTGLFRANPQNSGIALNSYKMDRYISGYAGIQKMLASAGAKLLLAYHGGDIVLSAVPYIDYSREDEFDSSQISMDVTKNYAPVNHVVCLGQGDLAERTVIHLYADAAGNVSYRQSLFGIHEITVKYDYSSAESVEELEKGGMDILKEAYNSDVLRMSLSPAFSYDIGDIVGAREHITGMAVSSAITKKIITIQNGEIKVSYKVGI